MAFDVLDDLSSYLDSNSSLLTVGSNLFLAELPSDVDECVALKSNGGRNSEYTFGKLAYRIMQIQFIIRSPEANKANILADEVYKLLDDKHDFKINNNEYVSINIFSDMSHFGRDVSNLYRISVTFEVKVKPIY